MNVVVVVVVVIVIVITGGSRGIGAATAIDLAKRGLGVILTFNSHPDAAASVGATTEAAGGKAGFGLFNPIDTGRWPER